MESIKDKLRKIKALADAGVAGEAKAAQYQLEKLLSKHNISIDELFDDTMKERKFKVSSDKVIYLQVLSSIIGNRAKEAYYFKGRPSEQYVKLTDIEYIDVKNQFDFHRKQLAKEKKKAIKQLEIAYVHKHHLYYTTSIKMIRRANQK